MSPTHPIAKSSPGRRLSERLEETLLRALKAVLEESRGAGHWGDVRGTSDSLIALSTCLPQSAFHTLRTSAASWLVSKSLLANDLRNWEEEVWDTAVALLALTGSGNNQVAIEQGLRWLAEHYESGHDNWNDEPWETLWALLAIHATIPTVGRTAVVERCGKPLEWLLSLVDRPRPGVLVSWHYTGLLVLVASRFASADVLGGEAADLIRRLHQARDRVVRGLLDGLALQAERGELWTRETWSNSLVLWAVAENEGLSETSSHLSFIIDHFRKEIERPNMMTEDRAFACIALFHLLVCLETMRESTVRKLVERGGALGLKSEHQVLLERLVDALEGNHADALRERLARPLSRLVRDFTPKPPLLSTSIYDGYYTVSARQKTVNVLVILAVTSGLTALTLGADLFSARLRPLVSLVPIGLGVLATLAQLLNLNVRELLGQSKGRGAGDKG